MRKNLVMDALVDFAIVIFAHHLWGDSIILQHNKQPLVKHTTQHHRA
jgi:hypothetical protein